MGLRQSGSPFLTVAFVILLVLVLAAVGLIVLDQTRSERIAEGIHVDGIAIGGLTTNEARAVIRREIARPLRREIVASRRDRSFTLDPEMAELEVNVGATVDEAAERSREGVPGLRTLLDVVGARNIDAEIQLRIHFSREAVNAFVRDISAKLDRNPSDATLEVSNEGLVTTQGQSGAEVDRAALRNRVIRALQSRDKNLVSVPVERRTPRVTLADLVERYPDYLIIDRERFRLIYYENLELKNEYRISVGDVGHRTPPGEYEISNKAVNPTWYVPDSDWAGDLAGEVIPPGPDNPIKARWLGIQDGIGIHGTDEVNSIGRRASRGCIRMRIPDVETLYDQVPVGTPTFIG